VTSDRSAPAEADQAQAPAAAGEAQSAPAASGAGTRACAKCGSPMEAAQDWCLHCGAGAPGSLEHHSGWRPGAAVIAATSILVLGAAAAAYAALTKEKGRAHVLTTTVAQSAPPASTPPAAATPGPPLTTPRTLGTPTTLKPGGLAKAVKPPKIPLTVPTPKVSKTTSTPAPAAGTSPTRSAPSPPSGGSTPSSGGESSPSALLLDTNAAATYNPYNYPAIYFGDPSLAIDGETSTGWTAQVDPAVAPRMAEGLLIDLKTARKLAAVVLVSSTPGMTIQVYGANAHAAPTSITDPAWVKLSRALVNRQRRLRLPLNDSSKAFRFVVLWISRAPASASGTAQAPGRVSVNELELFPR
jgi:hypothetical protein